LRRGGRGFDEVFARIAGRFAQACSRKRARAYLLGLLSRSERKIGWTIAELAGDATPDGMQRLLNFYSWSADAVRDDLRSYVTAAIGDPGGVLIPDETGFLKKGMMSAGVARQYSGTAGRVENCQVGVFLAFAVPGGGRALIDRELYLPQSWTDDRDRCQQAGIPDDRQFATKPELARQMIERAIGAGMPFRWVAADEVYGQHTPLRDWLEQQRVRYVLAVPKSFTVVTGAGKIRADELTAAVPAAGWQQVSCGQGAKGPRYYDWALIATTSPAHHPARAPVTDPRQQERAGASVLHLPCPSRHHAGRAGHCRRNPVGSRGMLPGRQGRDWPGPLSGPPLRRLVPARHPVDARAGLPPGHRRSKGAPAAVDNFPGQARCMIAAAS
jgi:SRSO17 transposase